MADEFKTGTELARERVIREAKARKADPLTPLRRAARKACKVARNVQVDVINGDSAPVLSGEPGGYVYGEGYEYSTLKITVGREWQAPQA